jgi:hypothetical protein
MRTLGIPDVNPRRVGLGSGPRLRRFSGEINIHDKANLSCVTAASEKHAGNAQKAAVLHTLAAAPFSL